MAAADTGACPNGQCSPDSGSMKVSGSEHAARQAAARRARALEALVDVVENSVELEIPAPVTEIRPGRGGAVPKLGVAAFEMARQVYYLNHGSMTDAARAVIAGGLSDTSDLVQVRERLQTWWARERWPKRQTTEIFVIRDASHDGGLYRSERLCIGEASGNGPAPKGKKCEQSALRDSDYCFHHDPRPEYVEARRRGAARLAKSRGADMVPLDPFCRWMQRERRRLLVEATRRGDVHPNNRGWSLLAAWMQIDQTLIGRMLDGRHNGAAKRKGRRKRTIRASTVLRYLGPTGVSFASIYGFESPPRRDPRATTCPSCGRRKGYASKLCRSCHDAAGSPCSYVNRAGTRCGVLTKHPSGICARCRRITERVHKPRTGRPSFVSIPMLILALGEYRDVPIHAWVGRRMWAANAGGVRDVFKSQKALVGSLVKQFAKRGIATTIQAEAAYLSLTAEHGAVGWPTIDTDDLEIAGMVPFEPFGEWIATRRRELGSYKAVGERLRMNPDNISKWLRGVPGPKLTIRRATVDHALAQWDDGTDFGDVYGRRGAR
jgi:hypothetical protein